VASAATPTYGVQAARVPPWVESLDVALMTATTFNLQNLRGQSLLFRCLDTGSVTTAPALTRYQQGRGTDPSRRELVGERPEQWCRSRPVTICEHCGRSSLLLPCCFLRFLRRKADQRQCGSGGSVHPQ
jgi:hypothetical protein